MKKAIIIMLSAFAVLISFSACSNTDENTVSDYDNWQARNIAYFDSIATVAKDSIQLAKTTYGDDWESYCNWRAIRSFALSDSSLGVSSNDSIYVQILRKGTGTVKPLYTDSIQARYRGRLIPTTSYPEGLLFTHTGAYTDFDQVFNENTAGTSGTFIKNYTVGIITATQKMVVGDLWRIYIPYKLGYGASSSSTIPAYSTLIFEFQVAKIIRNGVQVSP